ncbi:gastrula zinc finger protein XlCGF17.1-like [Engraulis encrasicolus]|uniref:gastrula zinc finger protein XlCGF17.1-like n=1 Tax=Engraulis encrasicolus TaxID=184585 RepID=UPI002FCE9952
MEMKVEEESHLKGNSHDGITSTSKAPKPCKVVTSKTEIEEENFEVLSTNDQHRTCGKNETITPSWEEVFSFADIQDEHENHLIENVNHGMTSTKYSQRKMSNRISTQLKKGNDSKQKGILKQLRTYTGKAYQCRKSGKAFVESSEIKTQQRTHSGDRSYQCSTCGQSFRLKGHLNIHQKIHTGGKPHQCTKSGKAFTQTSYLRKHLRAHTGGKPKQCTTCGKVLVGDLRRHMRTHTGEKPFQCMTCGKSFTKEGNLRRHQRIHTGEKPYRCSMCGKAFTDGSNCRRHERAHSGYSKTV